MSSRTPTTGVNDHLTEKVVRAPFFLQHCATADLITIAEHAIDVDYIGGFFGGTGNKDRCTPFACLLFRFLFLMGSDHHHRDRDRDRDRDRHHHQPQSADNNSGDNNNSSSGSSNSVTTTSFALRALSFLEEFIRQPHHKYLRIFGIICLRLMIGGSAAESNLGGAASFLLVRVHKALDVGFLDYRRVRMMKPDGTVVVTTVDQVCDLLMFVHSAASATGEGNNNNNNPKHEFLGLCLGMLPSRRQIFELFPEEKKNLLSMP